MRCITSHLLHIPSQKGKDSDKNSQILLQIVILRVLRKQKKVIAAYAMLDSGLEVALVNPSLTNLNLQGQLGKLIVSTVSNDD